jgi:SNF2 family DNA or RNA helicase
MLYLTVNVSQGDLRALLLTDSNFLPNDLYRYDVIITSYNYVASESSRMAKFDRQMEDFEQRKTSLRPKRPRVVLLSGIWKMDGVQLLGRYIALDESHAIKNSNGRTYAAIKQLRERFLVCLPTSGTPLDNTWTDIYAPLSLLRGHPFASMLRMREVFTDALLDSTKKKDKRLAVPKLHKLARLVRLLHACTLSRPASLFTRNLPPLHTQVISFDLPKQERELSNKAFNAYYKTLGGKSDDAAYGGKKDGQSQKMVKWSALVKATQLAFHPGLPRIMELVRAATKQDLITVMEMDDVQLTEEEQAEYDRWRSVIREGDNSRSARVDVLIDIVNRTRDRGPGDAILMLDESVFFLEIMEAALSRMHEPVDVFRYDGGQDPAERHQTMQAFAKASGTRVMLATRGAGGQGLNVQCANVVVRCGPWWKTSWEEQALARSYRPGQTKPVWLYEVSAKGCKVETYKRRLRGKKSKVNQSIMELVTMEEDQQPPAWNE